MKVALGPAQTRVGPRKRVLDSAYLLIGASARYAWRHVLVKPLHIFNTLSRTVEEFHPANPPT